ncbi:MULTISPECIES: S8 family serine peptidase [Aeromicrobium]|uniref:S8 family serine peptidase n=1 Tax=Aeromicrobium TaxID=2040 RepID=UPI00257F8604|nr:MULTISPECIES: S8 family serine peptidase [Aeromicrobium]
MTQRLRRPLTLVVPLVTSLALAGGAMAAVAQTEPVEPAPLNTTELEQPARGIIVKLADDTDAEVADLADDVAAELPDGVGVADSTSGTQDLGVLDLSEQVDATDLDDAIEELNADPAVEWAVPNGVRLPSATANDPYFTNNSLWNLTGSWGVQANRAWDISTGSPNVRVAVLDTGAILGHPDLSGQFVAGRDFVDDEYDCMNRSCSRIAYRRSYVSANDRSSWDANAADPGDGRQNGSMCPYLSGGRSSWHGTHVAGTIAAKRNNSTGVVGIAPTVKVQPVRVLGRCGGTDWDIAMGILWASGANVTSYDGRRHGSIPVNRAPSKVINLSLGGYTPDRAYVREMCQFYGQISSIARKRGSTLVAAAGNNFGNHAYNVPSSCPGFISVAATDRNGNRASFSNHGAGIDVAAPGVGIPSTYNDGQYAPGGNTYAAMDGTSMAAPAVAATAALAYSVGITSPDVVERVLKATARRAASCAASSCGAGVVNAHGVLTAKAPLTAPGLRGSARPGRTLVASPGRWRNGATVRLTWFRGSKAVRTGSTYRVTKADLGKRVTVRATATNGSGGIFHQRSVVVKSKSRLKFAVPSKFSKSKRVKLTVKVTAPYVRATGTIRVYDGKKRIAVKKIYSKNKGKVTIKLPKIKKKGKHRIRVIYSGSAKVSSAQKSKVVRVR